MREREWVHRPGAPGDVDRPVELLTLHAARAALAEAGIEPAELDLVVTATSTPDRIGASLSARLTAALGTDAAGLDVRAGGAGGIEAWITAASLLRGGARAALVVAGEVTSGYLDPSNPGSAALFGDGAAALVLRRSEGHTGGLLGAVLATGVSSAESFTVPGSLPPRDVATRPEAFRFREPSRDYVQRLRESWSSLGKELTQLAGDGADPIRATVLGVATRPQLEACAAPGPVWTALEHHGATGAAAVPIALDLVRRAGLPTGSRLLAGAVGGGIHRAGLLWRL